MNTASVTEPVVASPSALPSDEVAIKSYFATQSGRADIRKLWKDSMGTHYRVNFYITQGQGFVQWETMRATFFVLVHEGLVVNKTRE